MEKVALILLLKMNGYCKYALKRFRSADGTADLEIYTVLYCTVRYNQSKDCMEEHELPYERGSKSAKFAP
jgi:hypothetical protein